MPPNWLQGILPALVAVGLVVAAAAALLARRGTPLDRIRRVLVASLVAAAAGIIAEVARDVHPSLVPPWVEHLMRVVGVIGALTALGAALLFRRRVKRLVLQEARYRDLVNNTTDWMWEVDVDGVYVYSNPVVEQMLGWKPEEVVGRKLLEFVADEDLENVRRLVAELRANPERVSRFVNRNKRKDGSLVWLETSGVPVFDEFGRIKGFRGVDRDVTERVEYEETLKAQRNRAREYLDIAGVAIVVIGADQSTLLINRKGCDLLKLPEDEILGKNWFDTFVPESCRAEVKEAFAKLMSGEIEPVEYFENFIVTKTGEERLVAWHNAVLRDETGRITATISSGEDITERRLTEAALQEAEAKYRSLVEESLVGVYIIQDGRFSYVNPRLAEIFGYTQEEIIETRTVLDLVAPESRELVAENIRRRIEGLEKSMHYSFRALRKDGEIIEVEVHGARTMYGGRPAVIGSLLDVTERRRAEEEKRRLREEADEAKRKFYRETILAMTEGRLEICETEEIAELIRESDRVVRLSRLEDAPRSRRIAKQFLQEHGASPDDQYLWLLCIGEAVANVLKHAGSGKLILGHGDEENIWAAVVDKGPGIDALTLPKATLMPGFSTKPSLGMGYKIILSYADKVRLATGPHGTWVLIEKRLGSEQAARPISLTDVSGSW